MASSVSRRLPKSALTRAITFYQFISSFLIPVSLSASVPSSYGTLVASTSSSTSSSDFFAAATSASLASSIHPLICSAHIPEVTPE